MEIILTFGFSHTNTGACVQCICLPQFQAGTLFSGMLQGSRDNHAVICDFVGSRRVPNVVGASLLF